MDKAVIGIGLSAAVVVIVFAVAKKKHKRKGHSSEKSAPTYTKTGVIIVPPKQKPTSPQIVSAMSGDLGEQVKQAGKALQA